MYKLSLLVFVLISHFITFSQKEFKEWAPLGANWLYWKPTFSGENFCVRIAHDRDTTVFNHKYKVFDVYQLFVKPSFEVRYETRLGSYYIGIVGDTVFSFCKNQNRERYYLDKDIVGEKFYLFRGCHSSDSIWYRLDTVYYDKIGGITDGVKFKFKVYSSNAPFFGGASKDTLVEFMPFKQLTFGFEYGDNWRYKKHIDYKVTDSCFCSIPFGTQPAVYPEKFSCYYDPNFGSFDFYGGQCWLRNAYMSIVSTARKNFTIVPNPAGAELKIEIDDKRALEYFIYDMQGRLLQTSKLKNRDRIDISGLEKSTYYISVQHQYKVIGIQKFIKN